MGFISRLKSGDDKNLEELKEDIQEQEKRKLSAKGERRLRDLKKKKKKELKQTKKEAEREEFKQTKAGRFIDKLGNELSELAEKTDIEKAEELSKATEAVDGDGRRDTRSAFGIGLTKNNDKKDLEIEGDLKVEGDLVESSNKKKKIKSSKKDDLPPIFNENDNSVF